VYSPALTDGSIGDMIYFHSYKNPGLVLDIVEGMSEFPCCNFLAYCHFWHRLHTVHGWVWNCWSSVHLSVCPSVPSFGRHKLLWARRVADIDRLLHGWWSALSSRCAAARHAAANVGSATVSADVGSWTETFCFFFHLTNFLQLLHVFPDFLNCDC